MIALDLTDGSIKWTYIIANGGHGVNSATIGNDGSIYFIWCPIDNSNITVYALNPDGSVKWTSLFDPSVYSDLSNPLNVAPDGTIYMATKSRNDDYEYTGLGKLYALNATTGAEIWHYDVGDISNNENKSGVVDNDGTIYLGNYSSSAGAKKLYAINSDGTLKWEKDYGISIDYGYKNYVLRSDGVILCLRFTADSNYVLEAIDIDDGSLLWTSNISTDPNNIFTDKNNGLYLMSHGPNGSEYATNLDYYDSNNNLKWKIFYTYDYMEGNDFIALYLDGDKVLDDRGWLYGTLMKNYWDESWNNVPANEYIKYFAMAPWTLSESRDSVYYYSGDTINFTVTSSMLSTNVVFGGDNKVQVVVDNGDKIPLTYQSLNSAGNSIWTGSYTIPSGLSPGDHTYTVEASQPYVQTDITTRFASAPTQSSNTGITVSNSFNYITSFGSGALACSQVVPPAEGFKVSINNGAIKTNSREILINSEDYKEIVNMAISNELEFNNVPLQSFSTSKNWVLTPNNGQKTVYVKLYNSCGESSSIIPVSIILEELDALSSILMPTPTPTPTPILTDPQALLNSLFKQLADLQQQLANQQQTKYQFTKGIQYGDTGEDVTQLQTFLKAQGTDIYPEGLITGYFGNLTKLAVQRFQEKYNIAKSGDEGYGYVGPKTRAKINSL